MSRVLDILEQRPILAVAENETVLEAARKMASAGVGAILVLRGRELLGLFTERDLLTRVVVGNLSPATTAVSDVMSTELTTIRESATVDDAMALMHRGNFRHLPVVRGGAVCGMLSMRDLMNYELESKGGGDFFAQARGSGEF